MKAVVIVSGGMDSATLLYDVVHSHVVMGEEAQVYALTFNYNQRHKKEIIKAKKLCRNLKVPHKVIDISQIGKELLQGSSQTSDKVEVPHGHYESENMKLTVVPNRNMIMLSMAAGYAFSIGAERIYYGAHGGDHAIYPDCRHQFVSALNRTLLEADWKKALVVAPYLSMDKAMIAKRGLELGVPFKDTWTCYEGKDLACGKCGSCQERLEAFKKNGVIDPIKYRKK